MSLQSFGQKYLKIMNKAQSYMDKKKYDKAIKLYDKVIELNPNYSSAFGNRAIAKAKKNNHNTYLSYMKIRTYNLKPGAYLFALLSRKTSKYNKYSFGLSPSDARKSKPHSWVLTSHLHG